MFDLIWEMSTASAAKHKIFLQEATVPLEKWLQTANLASFGAYKNHRNAVLK